VKGLTVTMPDSCHTPPEHTCQPDVDPDPRGLLYVSDVQALQLADTVVLHHRDGVGHIDAGLTTWAFAAPRIYTARQQRLFPDADGHDRRRRIKVASDVVGYADNRRWHEHGQAAATALATVHAAGLDDVWRTVAALLRTGDIIGLHWTAGNNSRGIDEAGLHTDELRLVVHRGRRRWVFLLDVRVGVDNTNRMIVPQPVA